MKTFLLAVALCAAATTTNAQTLTIAAQSVPTAMDPHFHRAIAGWQPRAFAEDAAIAVGALVAVDDDGRARQFLIAGHGGGLTLPGQVTVVTPSSPIGRALLGRRVDEDCEVDLGGGSTLTSPAMRGGDVSLARSPAIEPAKRRPGRGGIRSPGDPGSMHAAHRRAHESGPAR